MAIVHCEVCGHDFIAQFGTNVFCPECSLHGPAEAARLHDFTAKETEDDREHGHIMVTRAYAKDAASRGINYPPDWILPD